MNRLRTLLRVLAAFGFMVGLIEAVIAASKWWRGEKLTSWEWVLLGALPILFGIYLRYFSIFGCTHGRCLTPPDDIQR